MKPNVELTLTARRQAEATGLLELFEAAALEPSLIRGDVVEVVTAAGIEKYQVQGRRLHIAADGTQRFVIELDHPARARS